MSTHAFASSVIPAPIDSVWKVIRDFSFPSRVFSSVASVKLVEGACGTCVGAVREVQWHNGSKQRHRLIALSDHHYSVSWELMPNENPDEVVSAVSAVVTHVKLQRVSDSNGTLVSWSSDFSSDVAGGIIRDAQEDYAANLRDLRRFFQSQSKTVLYYWGVRARGQVPMIISALGGLNVHWKKDVEWPAFKPNTPLGQLPVLEDDGFKIPQSVAIVEYLANKAGLLGDTPKEFGLNQAVVQVSVDLYNDMVSAQYSQDKKAGWTKFVVEQLPKHLEAYEKLMAGDFVGGCRPLVGDCSLFGTLHLVRTDVAPDCLAKFARLQAFYDRFASIPSIKAFVEGDLKASGNYFDRLSGGFDK